LPKAATGIGGMGRNITRPTTAIRRTLSQALSNVYQALGAAPPDSLAQPITGAEVGPSFVPQTAYIHPRVTGDKVRYFEWMGAAMYTADKRAGAMHGKQFLLDSVYAGIDASHVYGRLDFMGKVPEEDFDLVVKRGVVGQRGVASTARAAGWRPRCTSGS